MVNKQSMTTLGRQFGHQLSRSLVNRIRTGWRPVQLTLRPSSLQAQAGQWMPPFAQAIHDWRQWCERHPGASVALGLSAHWLLVAVDQDPAPSWERYYGLSAEDLRQAWVMRSVLSGAAPLQCAAPLALLDGIRQAAKAHAVQLRWVGPWWIHDLQRHVAQLNAQGGHLMPWQAREPGLRIQASMAWGEPQAGGIHLRQVWCEAVAGEDGAQPASFAVCEDGWPVAEAA